MTAATDLNPSKGVVRSAGFDESRAILRGPDMFPRFPVTGDGTPLSLLGLPAESRLFVFERNGQRRAVPHDELAYWHIAQGSIANDPYAVAFCAACNTAVGFTPTVDGVMHHFSLGGVYNGKMLMIDDETRTYWDYVTGEAVYGALAGTRLDVWNVESTTVRESLELEPELLVHTRRLRWFGKLVAFAGRYLSHWLPPGFGRTLGRLDRRQPKMEMGFGIVTESSQWFLPIREMPTQDAWEVDGRRLVVESSKSRTPLARFEDGTRPLQFMTRWYAFSLTFPSCSLYSKKVDRPQ
ncbi:MAG: DUF3179 domain-containing (seleno)protein [Planctomycetota bacterium]|nr:DUF3179 domain-containing (seleno)protein [Planctomycetota bacterium]